MTSAGSFDEFRISKAGTGGPEFGLKAIDNGGIKSADMLLPWAGSRLGIGTSTPAGPLHVAAKELAYITLERTTTSSGSPGKWYISHENNEPNDFIISKDSNPVALRLTSAGHLTLWQAGSRLGIGTNAPADQMHVAENGPAGIRLENTSVNQTWRLRAGNANNFVINDPNGNAPFTFTPGGDLGIGTTAPTADLHVKGSDDATDHGELILETAVTGQQWRLRSNNGTGDFVISDITGTVTNPFKVSIDANSNLLHLGNTAPDEVNITGKLIISGTCTSESADCASDYVFDPGYRIESIEDHAAAMWSNSYLPAVGPTPDNNGKGGAIAINVLQKTTGMLNELEKAHIYIERLHERLKAKEARVVELERRMQERDAAMAARLVRLEALVSGAAADD